MKSSELEKWEARLSVALRNVDHALEEKYGKDFTRRPGRPACGVTSNSKYDGIFSLDAKFSLGYATGDGPGYTVDMRVIAEENVPGELFSAMLDDAADMLDGELKAVFPENVLFVKRVKGIIRITGDMDFS